MTTVQGDCMCAPHDLEQAITLLRTLEHQAAEAGHDDRALQIQLVAEDYEAELARSTTGSVELSRGPRAR